MNLSRDEDVYDFRRREGHGSDGTDEVGQVLVEVSDPGHRLVIELCGVHRFQDLISGQLSSLIVLCLMRGEFRAFLP